MADSARVVSVILAEWERTSPELHSGLSGLALDAAAAAQVKALGMKLRILPAFGGLEVEAMSNVGHVAVGPLHVTIRPKLSNLPLTRLLRYAYGLRDLGSPLDLVSTPMAALGLQDILVALLAAEAEELLHGGLARQYAGRDEWLGSPRGRLLTGLLARRGGIMEARLPCHYVERRADWPLNQVLRAGLRLAAGIAVDPDLCRRVQQLHCRLDGIEAIRLSPQALAEANRLLTRLTAAYEPALTLIALLLDAHGPILEEGRPTTVPGFLFDMNSFFQRLLSRFLRDNLPVGQRIQDERTVRGVLGYAPGCNPRARTAPRVRPDYALIEGNAPTRFLDAKYRDVWGKGYPAEWLYQLSMYAMASPHRVSVLLYATTDGSAREERIEVRPSVMGLHKVPEATVIMRPVLLPLVAELVRPGGGNVQLEARQSLARALVAGLATRTIFEW